MKLDPIDAICIGAIFQDVATSFELIKVTTQCGKYDADDFGNEDLDQDDERVLRLFGHLRKKKNKLNANDDISKYPWRSLEDKTELRLYLQKLREYCSTYSYLFSAAANEVLEEGTCSKLEKYVEESLAQLSKFKDVLAEQKRLKNQINELNEKLINNRKEMNGEILKRKEIIAHLSDQRQEFKFRTGMETAYVQKSAAMNLKVLEECCEAKENQIFAKLTDLNIRWEFERRCGNEVSAWTLNNNAELKMRYNHMLEKKKEDVEKKTLELEEVTRLKDESSMKLEAFVNELNNMQHIVLEDRTTRKAIAKVLEYQENQRGAAQVVQNWWRTMLVLRRSSIRFGVARRRKGKGGKSKANKRKN